jgi:protein-S-isoprenylcysteine O-methyltransferase Ste14
MNLRLVSSRVAVVALIALALVSTHAWHEHGVVDAVLSGIGYAMLLVGAIGRIWCAVYIAGRKNRDLVVDGPFSMTRNPLYFFSFVAFVGAGLSFESITLAIVFGIVFFATHWRAILREERTLAEIFGSDYEAYVERVPRFLPRPRLYAPAAVVTLSVPVFVRAMVEAGLIPLAFLGAQAIEAGHDSGLLPTLLWLY